MARGQIFWQSLVLAFWQNNILFKAIALGSCFLYFVTQILALRPSPQPWTKLATVCLSRSPKQDVGIYLDLKKN